MLHQDNYNIDWDMSWTGDCYKVERIQLYEFGDFR